MAKSGSDSSSTFYSRAYRACIPCRAKKQKCDLGDLSNPKPPCARCRRSGKNCVFSERRAGSSKSESNDGLFLPTPPIISINCQKRDIFYLLKAGLSCPNDALFLLRQATSVVNESHVDKWSQLDVVKSGLLSSHQVDTLIDFFYTSMLPYSLLSNNFPNCYNDNMLTLAVLLVASRYSQLGSPDRSYAVHERLLTLFQKLIDQLVWGDESCRTAGMVMGILVVCEWYPRFDFRNTTSFMDKYDNVVWMLLGIAQNLSFEINITSFEFTMASDEISLMYWFVNMYALQVGYRCTDFSGIVINSTAFDLYLQMLDYNRKSSEMLFPSGTDTRSMIENKNYLPLLENCGDLLRRWKIYFDSSLIEPTLRQMLELEYEYQRMHTFSVALQSSLLDGVVSSLDQEFVSIVIGSSSYILQSVANLSFPLKVCPTRMYYRICEAALIYMKAACFPDLHLSFELLNLVIVSLKHNAIDEMHFGTKIAQMLQNALSQMENATQPEQHDREFWKDLSYRVEDVEENNFIISQLS